ncbi:hypothetical protein KAS50_07825, partial [bacterium]|nr:hypothetical protein [bacterium]
IISSKGIVYGGEEGLPFVELGNKLSRQVGTALGAEALRRIQFVKMDDDITIRVLRKNVKLSIKKTPPPDSPGFIKSYYNRIIDHSVSTEYIITEIETIKIEDIYILTLPAEVLVNVGLEIKKRAGIKNLFIISNCNDALGCICHSEAYEEGGHQSGGDTNLAKGTGEIVIEEALTMLNQIK